MTVSEYVFSYLAGQGCRKVFMVSGSSAMWLTDALQRSEQLQAVCCHHEQAAAMAADGCGRIGTGEPGVCLVTIGPGATNAVTGVAGAYLDSSPMVVLSGQANSRLLQYENDSGIRQIGTQSLPLGPLVGSITKYFAEVMKPETIRYHMERACYEATHGRPGPVWLDIPVNVQNMQVPEQMEGFTPPDSQIACDLPVVQRIAELLQNAKRPLILAGHGVRLAHAAPLLKALAERLSIPVVTSRGGIDVIESDHRLFVGRPGGNGDRPSHFAIQSCDVLLILGSRLSASTTGYYPDRFGGNATRIMVDIDPKELDKQDVPIDIRLRMDLQTFLTALCAELPEQAAPHNAWLRAVSTWKEQYPVVQQAWRTQVPRNAYAFTERLAAMAPGNASVVVDTGSVCNIVSQTWKVKQGQRYLISGGLSCMGFWAAALGPAALGRTVLALAGDGSTQMNIQEFATIAYHKLPIKLFVYQNNGYMLIRHNQHNYMNDRFLGVGPDSGVQTPDFCKVAHAYGVPSVRIDAEDDLETKIREVLETEGPMVCEVMLEQFGALEPRIASKVMPDGSLKAAEFEDLYPFIDTAKPMGLVNELESEGAGL